MTGIVTNIWTKVRTLTERYPAVVAAIVIYFYYLLTSFDLFQHHNEKRSFLDYVMQFDSLFFLWLAAALLMQLQKTRKETKGAEERRHDLERILDRQQIYGQLVTDITKLLQDNVNNPLAVISMTAQEIRRRFEKDEEILRWLDRIEGALQRISNTIRDIREYETSKMIDASAVALTEKAKL